jgi:hypothetical protein
VSEVNANPQAENPTENPTGFGGLPSWLRIGIVAAATIVVVLIFIVIIRIVLQTPNIPLGVTPAADLEPGSCLLEAGAADEYTVVSCVSPHQQQVIASVDLAFPGVNYTADESLAIFADETCARLLEYRLFLPEDFDKFEYTTTAIAAPGLADYEAGDTETLCAIQDNPDSPETGGGSDDLTTDLYRPMPRAA